MFKFISLAKALAFTLSETSAAAAGADMDGLLGAVGSFLSSLLGWVVDVTSAITSNPLLLLFVVAIPVAGIVLGLVRSFIGRKRGR